MSEPLQDWVPIHRSPLLPSNFARSLGNFSSWPNTKHIDIRAHFVRSFVMDEEVTIDFVKSAENTSDIMTKNQQTAHSKSAHGANREESSI